MDTTTDRLTGIVTFLQGAERLKDTLRSAHTGQRRRESVAEHSWRLCLLAMLLERETDVDLLRLLKLCVIHDLGEAISGDVPATDQSADDGREARERADFVTLCAPLPRDLRTEMAMLCDEYAGAATREARMAKGLDKLETILQHAAGRNPDAFDYAFNLEYGRIRTDADPLLRALRDLADAATRARMADG